MADCGRAGRVGVALAALAAGGAWWMGGRDGESAPSPRARPDPSTACTTADVAACVAAADFFQRVRAGDENYYRAAACQLGDEASCARWERLAGLRAAHERAEEGEGPPAELVGDCRAGDLEACQAQVWMEITAGVGVDTDAARRACDAGYHGACWARAQAAADPDISLQIFTHGCERELVAACRTLYSLHVGGVACEDVACPPPDPVAAALVAQRIAALTGKPFEPPEADD